MRHWTMLPTLAASALVLTAATLPASAAGTAAIGHELATRWCAGCHLVEADQASANVDVPTFFELAKRPDIEALRAFIADPHPPMPNLSLTPAQIDDLLAYIASLKAGETTPAQ